MSHTISHTPSLVSGFLQRATKELLLLTILFQLIIPSLPHFLLLRTTRKQQHVLCPQFTLPHSPPPVCPHPVPFSPNLWGHEIVCSHLKYFQSPRDKERPLEVQGWRGSGEKAIGRARRTGTHSPRHYPSPDVPSQAPLPESHPATHSEFRIKS